MRPIIRWATLLTPNRFLLFLLILAPSVSYSSTSCLLRLRYLGRMTERLQKLEDAGKKPQHKFYFPADYREGEARRVLVYLHGFGSSVEAYENIRERISHAYFELGAREPIVLSLSMGPVALAGLPEQGSTHPYFVSVADYWAKLETALDELPFEVRKVSFLANSAGALNAFQMLRHGSRYISVDRAVFCSFPNFNGKSLAPNPALLEDGNRDPRGTAMRAQVEPLLGALSQDPHFLSMVPWSAFDDGSFPTQTRMLIQAPEFDALGYTSVNQIFVEAAQQNRYPVILHFIPGEGHGGNYNNALSVRFLEGSE